METLANGNTILVYEEATSHFENDDDVIHIRFSDDNGATWTAEDTDLNGNAVAGFPTYPDEGLADPYGPGGTYIFQAPNGDIWQFCWKADYDAPGIQGGWRCKSSDNGLTWTAWEALQITGLTETENTKAIFEEAHFIYEGVIYAVVRIYDVLWSTVKATFIKSTDNGATWEKVSDCSTYANATHEMAMTYLGDNRILMLARDASNGKSMRLTSSDFGATWSGIARIETAINVIGRQRMFTFAQLKGEANWWTDTRLVMVGFVLMNQWSSHPRRNAVWLSRDAGNSWTGPLYLDDETEDAGYGDLIYDPDTETFRVITYQGNLLEANLVQYNFKVTW